MKHNRTPIASAVALALMGSAYAQEAANLNTVVVTGIRASIENSIAVKRNSDSIVEAITAEDIGKLPDVSIADSIARLPGLSAQRVAGRAQVISIRGMSDDFAVTLMNGRELVSTGLNRGVEYDQYPSELINGVTVYKTPDATLSAQGVSGTVNLQTLRPLDLKERSISVNLRGEKNGNGPLNADSSDKGQRFSISYVDQFANKTIGLAIGFAHLDSPMQEKHYGSWGWDNSSWNDPTCNGLGPNTCDVTMIQGAEFQATSSKQVRDGFMATLEFKPSKDFHSMLDLYYSKFDQTTTARGLLWSNAPSWDGTSISDPVIGTFPGTSTRLVTGGTFNGVYPVEQSNLNTRQDTLSAIGWNNKFNLDKWKFDADLSYSRADRKERTLEMYAGLGAFASVTDNFKFSIPASSQGLPVFTSGLDYADSSIIKLSDPAWWGQNAFERQPTVKDQMSSFKFSGKHDLSGIFSEIEAGLNYSHRTKDRQDYDQAYYLKDGADSAALSSDLIISPTSIAFSGIPAVLAYDIQGALTKYMGPPVRDAVQASAWRRNYTISEKITTGFAKLGIDTALGNVPIRGNLGLQAVRTDQHATGTANNELSASLVGGATYTDVLPSLNLNFDLHQYSKDTYLRFGAAQTVARPRLEDLKAGISGAIGTDPLTWSGSGGNPALQPWRADALDLSAEKYFGKRSYVAGAVFYKNLKNYIYNQQSLYDFTGFPNPGNKTPICLANQTNCNIGVLNIPTNGEGGVVKGTELSASFEGALLSRYLDGFGVLASVSNTQSTIKPNGPDGASASLPGLSGLVSNVTLFYEKDGFSTRLSQRQRSAFRAEALGPHGDRVSTEIMADSIMDFQIGYAFETGQLKGLSVLLQVNNLQNTPYRERYIGGISGNMDALGVNNTYGRQMLLGLNYKM
ncbi:MAG: TonB-dependent receptor [Comamonadaceae bacterium]